MFFWPVKSATRVQNISLCNCFTCKLQNVFMLNEENNRGTVIEWNRFTKQSGFLPLNKFIIIKEAYISHVVFVVLFTFLRTLSAPKLCVRHHCPVHIPFPSTQTELREEQLALSALGQFCRTFWFTSFVWFSSSQGCSECSSVPATRSFQALLWLGHPREVTGPSWCHGLGTERPSPVLGLQHQPLETFPGSSSVSGEKSPPAPPWLLCRSSWAVRGCPFLCWGYLWRAGAGFSWSSSTEGHPEPFWLRTSWKA